MPVARADLPQIRSSWPRFAERLHEVGFHSVQALPMRLRDDTIGALNLFRTESGQLSQSDLWMGQAMAHVATVGLLQQRVIAARELLAEQLQSALNSRVQLEQAKGVLAERTGLSMGEAFAVLRGYARSHGHRLGEVAQQIIDGELGDELVG